LIRLFISFLFTVHLVRLGGVYLIILRARTGA